MPTGQSPSRIKKMSERQEKEQLSLGLDSANNDSSESKSEQEKVESALEWSCHPAKKNMKVTYLVTAFIIILIGVVYYATDYSVLFAGLAVLILFGSLASFYFPTKYRLTENDIIIKTKMQKLSKKWSQYRSYYPDKNGVLLSPFVRPTRMENFRGLYIKFWFNRDEVVAFVKERLKSGKEEKEEKENAGEG